MRPHAIELFTLPGRWSKYTLVFGNIRRTQHQGPSGSTVIIISALEDLYRSLVCAKKGGHIICRATHIHLQLVIFGR